MKPKSARSSTVGIVGCALLVVSLVTALVLGAAGITIWQVWNSFLAKLHLGGESLSPALEAVIWQLRLPRILTAAAVGAGLAMSGAIMQAVTRNPLADPYLLGLSSGASFGAVMAIFAGISAAAPAAAFAGAMAALLCTMALTGLFGQRLPSRIVLAGVAVTAGFSGLTSLAIFWSVTSDSYREVLSWLLGSLARANWSTATYTWVATLVSAGLFFAFSNSLDGFLLGDRTAQSLGINTARVRWLLLVSVAVLTGILVAASGAIGFVGLVIPHAVRLVSGHQRARVKLPLVALCGAIFLIWADTAARTIVSPRELPVGIVTSLLGAPVFAALLARRRGQI
ncbi:MAG: iron chelate uptake ABC transporter family permease subunit [Micrococcales bacterium]|nr:iron chelate uptake ABC transporter family permease subunit [Micrococcales bacterium]